MGNGLRRSALGGQISCLGVCLNSPSDHSVTNVENHGGQQLLIFTANGCLMSHSGNRSRLFHRAKSAYYGGDPCRAGFDFFESCDGRADGLPLWWSCPLSVDGWVLETQAV